MCERLSATKQTMSAIIKRFLKLGLVSLPEAKNDRRNKIVRLTGAGVTYTEKIIPRRRDGDAMCELSESDMAELVRVTTLFSDRMTGSFAEILEAEAGAAYSARTIKER